MKRHNVRRLLALVLVAALCLLCGAAAQPNAKEIHIYSADDLVQLSKSCKLDTYSQGKTVYLDNDVDLSGSDFVPDPDLRRHVRGAGPYGQRAGALGRCVSYGPVPLCAGGRHRP